MIIIAFCTKTTKILPRILCRHFRHCAPIILTANKTKPFLMYQFVRAGNIVKISLSLRDLKILRAHGWEFVYLPGGQPTPTINADRTPTCVIFTKRAMGLHHMRIQTPDALYRYIILKFSI